MTTTAIIRIGARVLLLAGGIALGIIPAVAREEAVLVRGREVYIAEGCINCHSQYVRPSVPEDVIWWGPVRALASAQTEAPPLLGLRRQGPDLTNVGNRRSAEWQRLHLIAPQKLSSGSRMPSYAYLFRPGDGRGDALVAYLGTRGDATMAARQEQIAAWAPSPAALAAPYDEAVPRREFALMCASCHGAEARGDGPLAGQLSLRPPDFSRDAWRHVRTDDAARVSAVARIIKFGLPGLPMAGHEYLDDAAVVALARYVDALHH